MSGDVRGAYFLAIVEDNVSHIRLGGGVEAALTAGQDVVSAAFVTPYPPGFPVLVPGQRVSLEIVRYLNAMERSEIHGYEPSLGLRVFKDSVLTQPASLSLTAEVSN